MIYFICTCNCYIIGIRQCTCTCMNMCHHGDLQPNIQVTLVMILDTCAPGILMVYLHGFPTMWMGGCTTSLRNYDEQLEFWLIQLSATIPRWSHAHDLCLHVFLLYCPCFMGNLYRSTCTRYISVWGFCAVTSRDRHAQKFTSLNKDTYIPEMK